MDPELARLEQARADLDAQIVKIRTGKRVDAIHQIKALMVENGVVVSDLVEPAARRHPYSDGNGNNWSGVGRHPLWLVKALASGKTLDDFKVRE